ncbi:MAG TPA: hypothetical protein VHW02_11555 [Rhizomicrobium sp.]|jgi:hypothetical protein|nr:hypothetical protein [Rhizomicrobium sp.]
MQLKIQRSQRAGVFGTPIFCLDVRADYAPQERDNVRRYRLGGEVVYNSQAARKHLGHATAHLDNAQSGSNSHRAIALARGVVSLALAKANLTITLGSLARGHHIECKDLGELLDAEDAVRDACKGVTRYLETAASFDGSEVVIEYDRGEERVCVTQNAPPLLSYEPERGTDQRRTKTISGAPDLAHQINTIATSAKSHWLAFEQKAIAFMLDHGRPVGEVEVRAACGITAAVIALLLWWAL